jgi:hypothetical protein
MIQLFEMNDIGYEKSDETSNNKNFDSTTLMVSYQYRNVIRDHN